MSECANCPKVRDCDLFWFLECYPDRRWVGYEQYDSVRQKEAENISI